MAKFGVLAIMCATILAAISLSSLYLRSATTIPIADEKCKVHIL